MVFEGLRGDPKFVELLADYDRIRAEQGVLQLEVTRLRAALEHANVVAQTLQDDFAAERQRVWALEAILREARDVAESVGGVQSADEVRRANRLATALDTALAGSVER